MPPLHSRLTATGFLYLFLLHSATLVAYEGGNRNLLPTTRALFQKTLRGSPGRRFLEALCGLFYGRSCLEDDLLRRNGDAHRAKSKHDDADEYGNGDAETLSVDVAEDPDPYCN